VVWWWNKPCRTTSTTVVVEQGPWALNANKAGHADARPRGGPAFWRSALGEATKTVPSFTDALKAYEFSQCVLALRRIPMTQGAK